MRFLLPVLTCLLAACGARTLLEVDPPPGDAGTDVMPDAPPTRELRIDCGRSVQFTTPRQAPWTCVFEWSASVVDVGTAYG